MTLMMTMRKASLRCTMIFQVSSFGIQLWNLENELSVSRIGLIDDSENTELDKSVVSQDPPGKRGHHVTNSKLHAILGSQASFDN